MYDAFFVFVSIRKSFQSWDLFSILGKENASGYNNNRQIGV